MPELDQPLHGADLSTMVSTLTEQRSPMSESGIDPRETDRVRARYDRAAPVYDLYEGCMERLFFRDWRRRVWEQLDDAAGANILEVGVGTGKNIPYYPPAARLTAIDISERMLARARRRAERLGTEVRLFPMDAQALAFADGTFDAVVATFVFCSVPDPALGLREVARALRPGGRAVLLEHMRPRSAWLDRAFDAFNPLAVRLTGANINRRTLETVRTVDWRIEAADPLSAQDIVRLIVVRKREE